jgi:hypothetical protein
MIRTEKIRAIQGVPGFMKASELGLFAPNIFGCWFARALSGHGGSSFTKERLEEREFKFVDLCDFFIVNAHERLECQ